MIHEAYMPVYMGSRFLARDGRTEVVQEALADLKIYNYIFLSDPSPINALLNFAQIVGFVKVVKWISLSCYMDLSNLIHGFLYTVVTWTCQT